MSLSFYVRIWKMKEWKILYCGKTQLRWIKNDFSLVCSLSVASTIEELFCWKNVVTPKDAQIVRDMTPHPPLRQNAPIFESLSRVNILPLGRPRLKFELCAIRTINRPEQFPSEMVKVLIPIAAPQFSEKSHWKYLPTLEDGRLFLIAFVPLVLQRRLAPYHDLSPPL